jgi:malonyl-CoA/methylmalonyl-CoA synthetase
MQVARNKVPQLIERAWSFPDRVAFADPEGRCTYAELLARSEAIAANLLAGRTDLQEARIAFAAPGGADYAAIQWGIWRAGGIAVPLNIQASPAEMRHCTDTAGVEILLATDGAAESVAGLCEETGIPLISLGQVEMDARTSLPAVAASRRAMIIFTSGTTSKPKGVVTTHANIEAQIATLVDFWRWEPNDVIPLFLPMHHVHGIINVMSCALWMGARVEGFPGGFDAADLCERVRAGAYSLFMAVPTIYVKLIQYLATLEEQQCAAVCHGFSAMRLMVSGSAALPVSIHQQWQALTGQVLLERYGMTEIGMALSNPYDGERRPGAVGVPLPGVEVQLVGEAGEVVEGEDRPGEIRVRGDNVFLEYWRNPVATRESFSGGWFRTGDMAVRESGYYRIMGRLSVDIIKSGGYKLSALEIENYLLEHAAIKECAVIGVEDTTWGEIVAAAAVLESGSELNEGSLRDWAQGRMSSYKIPRRLQIVSTLPRNAMGKVTKQAVKELFQQE